MSHDKVTRFLSGRDYTSKDLWMQVKGVIRQVEGWDGGGDFDLDNDPGEDVDRRERSDLLAPTTAWGARSRAQPAQCAVPLQAADGAVAFELSNPLQCDRQRKEVAQEREDEE